MRGREVTYPSSRPSLKGRTMSKQRNFKRYPALQPAFRTEQLLRDKALSGDLVLVVTPATLASSAAAVNAAIGGAGAKFTRNVTVELKTAAGELCTWFTGSMVIAASDTSSGTYALDGVTSPITLTNGRAVVPTKYTGSWLGGTYQVETATVALDPGTAQVETATAAGTITTSGNMKVTVTAAGMTGSPKDIPVAVVAGTLQVETLTVAGAVTGAGDCKITVTAAGMTGSPKRVDVPVAELDDASAVAGKVRTALGLDANVSAFFTISGAGANVILAAKAKAANDETMNIAIDNDTCTGLTKVDTSADTTAGVVQDTATLWAAKARTALGLDADVTARFDVGGTGASIKLTRKVAAANDATLNIALADDTSDGVTEAASSADTTAGVAPFTGVTAGNCTVTVTCTGMTGSPKAITVAVAESDTAILVAGKIRTALTGDSAVAALFTVGGTGATITLTRKTKAANIANLNIAIANDTCAGLLAAPTSDSTTAGVAADTATLTVTGGTVLGVALGNPTSVDTLGA